MRRGRHRSSSSRSRSVDSYRREDRKHRRRNSYSRRSRSKCDCSRCHSRTRSPSHHRRVRFYGTRENPYKSRVLGVFGLSQSSNEAKLMQLFSPFGAVEHISLIYDAKTGNSRGFGFIYYSKIYEASEARKAMNGSSIDGRRIRVDFSITKRAHTPTPGEKMMKIDFLKFFVIKTCYCSIHQEFTWATAKVSTNLIVVSVGRVRSPIHAPPVDPDRKFIKENRRDDLAATAADGISRNFKKENFRIIFSMSSMCTKLKQNASA